MGFDRRPLCLSPPGSCTASTCRSIAPSPQRGGGQQSNQAAQTAAQTAQQKDQEAAQLNAAAQQAERAAQQAEAKAQGSTQSAQQAEMAVKEAAAAEAAYQKDAADAEQIEIKVLMKGWEAVSAIMTQFSRNSCAIPARFLFTPRNSRIHR